MMNNPDLKNELVDLSRENRKRIWKRYIRGFFEDLFATFGIVAFLLMGLAYVLLALTSIESTKLVAAGVGIGAGIAAGCYLMLKEVGLFLRLRTDLSKGECERLSVVSSEVIAVDLPDGRDAIAFNCGRRTLVLLGSWWKNSQRTDIEWRPANKRKEFPVDSFVIDRLPQSGKVVSVSVDGQRLKGKQKYPMEPELELTIPKSMESYWFEKPLDEIPVVEFSSS